MLCHLWALAGRIWVLHGIYEAISELLGVFVCARGGGSHRNLTWLFLFSCFNLFLQFLPLNGELLLAPGAGFAAFDGSWDAGCGSGTSCRAGRPSNARSAPRIQRQQRYHGLCCPASWRGHSPPLNPCPPFDGFPHAAPRFSCSITCLLNQ